MNILSNLTSSELSIFHGFVMIMSVFVFIAFMIILFNLMPASRILKSIFVGVSIVLGLGVILVSWTLKDLYVEQYSTSILTEYALKEDKVFYLDLDKKATYIGTLDCQDFTISECLHKLDNSEIKTYAGKIDVTRLPNPSNYEVNINEL